MKFEDAHAVPTFSSEIAPIASTPLDRWALTRIQRTVASAPVRFMLWDGFELRSRAGAQVGTILFKNRRALFSWVWDPDLNFGEAYMFGAVELRGDLVAMLCEIYRALGGATAAPLVAVAAIERRARGEGERPSPLRPRQRVLSPLARSRDGLHVRVLPDAGLRPRGGADRQDGSGVPEARAEAGRARGRSGMRMGIAGAVHGQGVRRHRARVQRLGRADCLRAEPGEGAEGLDGRVEFVEDDYRNVGGEYDAFVSVGMLEHVGPGRLSDARPRHRSLA